MSPRSVHLVGSLPFADEETAMRTALEILDGRLRSLPDGEIGERSATSPRGSRSDWVRGAQQRAIESGGMEVRAGGETMTPGAPVDPDQPDPYAQLGELDVRPTVPPWELAQRLDFAYLEWFDKSYPVFRRLREELGTDGLVFQLGVATPIALATGTIGPKRMMPYLGAFTARLAYEVNEAVAHAGDDVVVQLEVPIEVGMYQQLPRPLKRLPLLTLRRLVSKFDPRTRVGVHVCLGDFHHTALIKLDVAGLLVPFVNDLLALWPRDRRLEFVHLPLAEGKVPPRVGDPRFAQLAQLRLPLGTRPIMGFVHEGLSLDEHRAILADLEAMAGHPLDVASSCGLGRRDETTARQLLELSAALADS